MSFMVFNGLLWSLMVFYGLLWSLELWLAISPYCCCLVVLLSCCLVSSFHRFIVSSFHCFMWSGNLESLDLLPIT